MEALVIVGVLIVLVVLDFEERGAAESAWTALEPGDLDPLPEVDDE